MRKNDLPRVFAPGCALMLYKPELAERMRRMLEENLGHMDPWMRCCRKDPGFAKKTEVINICPGCDKRFRKDYKNSTTVSLWAVLAGTDFFPFPDYGGEVMTIIDACPTRDRPRVHDAVRTLLKKMNIVLKEPQATRTKGKCCGDITWGELPVDEVKARMRERASEMPADDVVVYCVSCAKAMFVGGRRPRYMIDLLFNEETVPKTFEPAEWHRLIDEYIDAH
ncbi:MAG TPA: (Fe-S)-binding protein [Terriglobales bacterium]|nr:(Fe-S)-binding protein [Terriglobales bacterium]